MDLFFSQTAILEKLVWVRQEWLKIKLERKILPRKLFVFITEIGMKIEGLIWKILSTAEQAEDSVSKGT